MIKKNLRPAFCKGRHGPIYKVPRVVVFNQSLLWAQYKNTITVCLLNIIVSIANMSEEHMTEAKLRHLQKEEERKKQKEKDRQMEENVLEWIEKVISKLLSF